MRKTLYVGNLASHEDAGTVVRLFSGCGKVVHFRVMAHADILCRDGGFAVVQMESEQDAIRAVRALDGSAFRGNTLTVRGATAVEETAAGRSRMFTTMNMTDDPEPLTKV